MLGGSGVAGARLVAGWSWLAPAVRMPEGTGIRLAAGRPVVLQLRYSLVAAGLGARVRASAEITVSRTEWVEEGEQIEREECAVFLYLLPRL